jgi:hypothetical protein
MEKAISTSWRNGQDPEELNLEEFLKLSVEDQTDELMAQTVLGNLPRLPKEFFTPENICFLTPTGGNLIHCAASYGQLEDVPLDIIPTDQLKEALLSRNDRGETIFHIAFNSLLGKWGDVVRGMLTREVLLMENDDRQTLFHWVAEVDGLDYLDSDSYDREMFLLEDATDKTPLYWAIVNGSRKVPESLLTEENLYKTSIYDENPICDLFVTYIRSYMSSEETCLQKAYLKRLLSKCSLEGLDKMWSKVRNQEYNVMDPESLIDPLFQEVKSLKQKKEMVLSRKKNIVEAPIEI